MARALLPSMDMVQTASETGTQISTRSPEMEECIASCGQCARACLELMGYCLTQGGEHARPEHIRLLLDCANACETSAKFMIRRSELHPIYCRACAQVCVQCAEDCARFQDDETMMRCAEICRRCADSCERMTKV